MALHAKYQNYLTRPTVDALATNAAINYIPTLTTINGATAILKHLSAQDEQLKKKNEKVLNTIESSDSLCIETEATLHFLYGGGAYLPGMEDNFLADKIITTMIVHIVTFDSEQKIQQIRLLWDQGSLLKSIDVIGRSGRNWPLHEGKDQARLIASSVALTASVNATTTQSTAALRHSKAGSRDEPLDLFSPRTCEREESQENPVATRESAKPPPRDYGDLFASRETASGESTSPSKRRDSHVRVGAGKNFAANRLFDQIPEHSVKANTSIKTNPDKFNHFEFGAGAATQIDKTMSRINVHGAQWDFADFTTPVKKPVVKRAQDVRHFGLGDNEGDMVDPPAINHVAKARRDQEAHFSFNDVTPTADKQPPFEPGRTGTGRNGLYQDHVIDQNGATNKDLEMPKPFEPSHAASTGRHGLYQDHVIDQNSATNKDLGKQAPFEPGRAASTGRVGLYEDHVIDQNSATNKDLGDVLRPITNVKQHKKTFEDQWGVMDGANENHTTSVKNVGQAKQRAARTMESHWDMSDDSPQKQQRGIKIAGNGMGSRIEGSGWWDF